MLAIGLLHHLPEELAFGLFRTAKRALKPGGRLVTLDGCYTQGQSIAARFMLSRDRGKYVRKAGEYVDLALTVFTDVKSFVLNRQLRIPYTYLVMEISA